MLLTAEREQWVTGKNQVQEIIVETFFGDALKKAEDLRPIKAANIISRDTNSHIVLVNT